MNTRCSILIVAGVAWLSFAYAQTTQNASPGFAGLPYGPEALTGTAGCGYGDARIVPGLTIALVNGTCSLQGTPTTADTYSFVLEYVSTSMGHDGQPIYTLVHVPYSITILAPTRLPDAQVNQSYKASLGTGTLCSLSKGTVPKDLSITLDYGYTYACVLIGIPNQTGTFQFVVGTGAFYQITVLDATPSTPSLVLDTTPIHTSANIGTTQVIDAARSISSSNSVPIQFRVSTSTTNPLGPNWLQASLERGSVAGASTPNTLAISANLQGFAPGTYTGAVTITPLSPSANGPQTISVTVNALGQDGYKVDFSPNPMVLQTPSPVMGRITVDATNATLPPMYFGVSVQMLSGAPYNWLNVNPTQGQTSLNPVTVTALSQGIPQGQYSGRIQILDTAGMVVTQINVAYKNAGNIPTLIAVPDSLMFTYTLNDAQKPAAQSVLLYASDNSNVPITASSDEHWISGNIAGSTPGYMNVIVDPQALLVGKYSGSVLVSSSLVSNNPLSVPVTLNVLNASDLPSSLRSLPHIPDGGGYQTTVTLVNTDTVPAPYTLRFWKDDGSPLKISLAAGSDPLQGTIPVGGGRVIRTSGQGPLVAGWGELMTSNAINGFATYRQAVPGRLDQEAAVPLNLNGTRSFSLPFDNTDVFVTTMAIANVSPSNRATVRAVVRDTIGNVLDTVALPMLPAHGHTAFVLRDRFTVTAGHRGVVEFTSDTDVSVVGLRFNNSGAFTSFDSVVLDGPADSISAKNIRSLPQVPDGGGYQTTITLVNTDSVAALYSLRFWDDSGNSLPISLAPGSDSLQGTIPVHGVRVIRTSGNGPLVAGWGELVTSDSINGFAIYRQSVPGRLDQEAAVPLNITATRHFSLPFDNTGVFATTMAIANTSASTQASISVKIRDTAGNLIEQLPLSALDPRGHTAFALKERFKKTEGMRGVAEFTSDSDVSVVGLRFNNSGAFTSFRVVPLK